MASASPTDYMPNAWRKRIHPRRSYPSAAFTKVNPGKKAAAQLIAHLKLLRRGLVVESADAHTLLRGIDAQIEGAAPSAPIAAAAVGALARYRVDYKGKPQPAAVVDVWVQSGGLPFAVDAMLHSMSFTVGLKNDREWTTEVVLREGDPEVSGETFSAPMFFHIANDMREMLFRLRCMLAVCADEEHRAALNLAEAHRNEDSGIVGYMRRVAASYLFPCQDAWLDADTAVYAAERKRFPRAGGFWRSIHLSLILASLRSLEDFDTANAQSSSAWPESPYEFAIPPSDVNGDASARFRYLPTMLEGMKEELLPYLVYIYDYGESKDFAAAMGTIPTDEAMTALMDRADAKHPMAALSEAVVTFPERAVRLLPERVKAKGKNHKALAALIEVANAAVQTNTAHALDCAPAKAPTQSKVKPSTPTSSKAKSKPTRGTSSVKAPFLLVDPPWNHRPKTKFCPVALEPVPYEASLAWAEGEEQDYWLQRWSPSLLEPSERFPLPGGYLETLQEACLAPKGHWKSWTDVEWLGLTTDWGSRSRVALGPEHLSWNEAQRNAKHPKYFYVMGTAIVRHGDRLLPLLIEQAKQHPKEAWVHLGPFDCAELAAPLASVLHVKKLKTDIERWFIRHPRAAAAGLIPDLLGKNAKARKAAALALKVVARRNASVVMEAATQYGNEVATRVQEILADDPRLASQPKTPTLWSRALPKPRLKCGDEIGDDAFDNLRIYLMLSELNDPLPGLYEVLEAFDEDSLAAFGVALFEAWERAGYPNDEKWVMSAQGFVGNDDNARMLTPLVRKWPGQSAHVRATHGLEALAAIGSDLALMGIYDIGERVKFKALKERASTMVKAIAQDRGLREEELADRLVPSLGLEDTGTLSLDFGARAFVVRFDEALKVDLRDADGKKLKALPKPTKADDAAKSKDAQKALSALKKDAKAIAASQLARLEKSMTTGRRWTAQNFLRFFAQHPLMRHLAQRLVWATYKEGNVAHTFRPTDEGTLVNSNDDAFALSSEDEVGILHPIDGRDADLAAWASALAEFEILQPFAQLDRNVYDSEAVLARLSGLQNVVVDSRAVLQLTKTGWSRGEPKDSGNIFEMTRRGWHLALDPGLNVADMSETPEQTLQGFFFESKPATKTLLSTLSACEGSELAWSLRKLA